MKITDKKIRTISRKKILVTKNIGIEAKENFKNNCKD